MNTAKNRKRLRALLTRAQPSEQQSNTPSGVPRPGHNNVNSGGRKERIMNTQEQAMQKLEKQGFRFSNWITADGGYGSDETEGQNPKEQTAVMVRHGVTRYVREYREVEADGSIH